MTIVGSAASEVPAGATVVKTVLYHEVRWSVWNGPQPLYGWSMLDSRRFQTQAELVSFCQQHVPLEELTMFDVSTALQTKTSTTFCGRPSTSYSLAWTHVCTYDSHQVKAQLNTQLLQELGRTAPLYASS